ncbi:MAG: hypothetical protein ABI623_11045 [bacterium]
MLKTVVSTIVLCMLVLGMLGCQDNSGFTVANQGVSLAATGNSHPADEKTGLIGDLLGKLLGSVLKLVGLNGGTLQIRATTFVIPSGALTSPTTISYSLWDATPPRGLTNAANRLFKFTPEGTTFSSNCTLTVPFAELNLGRTDPRTMICYYYNERTRSYEAQPTTVDMANQKFVVKIRHFSQYAFGRVDSKQ